VKNSFSYVFHPLFVSDYKTKLIDGANWVFQALTQAHILALQELLGRKGMRLVDLSLMKFSFTRSYLARKFYSCLLA
jgi:hypothetical protein